MSLSTVSAAAALPEASQTAGALGTADLAQQGIESFNQWEQSVFSIGLIDTLIYAAIVALITFVIIKVIQHTLAKRMGGNMRIFYRLIYVIIIVIAVICVLVTINPLKDLGTALLASSGIAGVVIGLAAQETLGNVFSGISISASKPFVVGEFIEILNVTPPIIGTVTDITLRHTVIRDASNKSIVIPNSIIDKDMIRTTHAHQADSPTYVNHFLDVGISYQSDIDLAIQIMTQLVQDHCEYIDVRTEEEKEHGQPAVTVRIMDFGDFAVKLRAFVWTKDAATGYAGLSDLRYAVKKEFARQGVEIPYPCQNVILKGERQHTKP